MAEKILFSIISISGGGAERQMRGILKRLNRAKFAPYLIVFEKPTDKVTIPNDIEVVVWNSPGHGKLLNFVSMVFWYIKKIREINPDLIVSFLIKMNLLTLFVGQLILRKEVIISERIYSPYTIKEMPASFFWKTMVRLFYPVAQKITAVSEDVADGLKNYFKIRRSKIKVINNGVDIEKINRLSGEYRPYFDSYILACGRLVPQKNFNVLIQAVSGLDKPLLILGEGPLRDRLRLEAEKNGVKLHMPGYVDNPYPYFKHAGVFVLSSKYEGFPNVLLEALACEVPVVAVSCPGGVNEIIRPGKNGLLVDSDRPRKMAGAIRKILTDRGLAKKLTGKACKTVSKYSMEDMVKKYEEIFIKVTQKSNCI